jgi:5-methylcytosine-specific restriction protein A
MSFSRGNRAIRDHAKDGRDLHLFEKGKGGDYTYLGHFAWSSWEYRSGPDRNGDERRIIVFHLIPLGGGNQAQEGSYGSDAPIPGPTTLEDLRARALESASAAVESAPLEARRHYRKSSAAVRRYGVARAAGTCESCGNPAPFERADGAPYLEPHHTRRLSDGGPDHPRWLGAACPNCHREMHHGADHVAKNHDLQQYLGSLENMAQ